MTTESRALDLQRVREDETRHVQPHNRRALVVSLADLRRRKKRRQYAARMRDMLATRQGWVNGR